MDASATIPAVESGSGAERASSWTRLAPGRFGLLLCLVIFAIYPDVVLGTHSFFYRDYGLFGYPLAFHLKESVWRGELPLWNPLNNCGLPFLAQWNTMALYPPSLFYVLLPLPWSLCVFNLAHLFLAGFGMYAFAWRWTRNELAAGIAGAAFAFNGLALHCLMWPNNIAAIGWMPWVVLCAERGWHKGGRDLLLAAAVIALQVLTGAPEIIVLTLGIVAVFLGGGLWKSGQRVRLAARAGMMVAFAGALTAIQLLPFLDLLRHSQRDRAFGGDAWSMPVWGWANLIVPLFHCTPSRLGVFSQDAQQWTSSYYMGIGTVALAVLATIRIRQRPVWCLAALALGGLVLSLGSNGLILSWLQHVCPALGLMRFPIKFVVLTVFATPALAAFGLDAIERAQNDNPEVWHCLFRLGLLLLASIALLVWLAFQWPARDEAVSITLRSGGSRAILMILILGAIRWHIRQRRAGSRSHWLIVGLFCLDGITHTPRQNPTVSREAFQPLANSPARSAKLAEARAFLTPSRLAFLESASSTSPAETLIGQRQALFSNCNLVEGIAKVDGFYSLYLKEEAEVRSLLYRSTNVFHPKLLDFLGVARMSSPTELFDWLARTSALPVLSVGQQPLFSSREGVLRELISAEFNPARVVYLPEAARASIHSNVTSEATILSSHFEAHRIQTEVEAAGPVFLVIAQAFYHPWAATVDGRPTPLWRANHAFQALEVPAGRHRVELTYRDWNFRVGAAVSALAVLGWVFTWFRFSPFETRPLVDRSGSRWSEI